MSRGLLLDSHILLWLESQQRLDPVAHLLIGEAAAAGRLFMSDISVWEFGVAVHKKSLERRPDLQGRTVQEWFRATTAKFRIRHLRISSGIAMEAANVPGIYGSGDPGRLLSDCYGKGSEIVAGYEGFEDDRVGKENA